MVHMSFDDRIIWVESFFNYSDCALLKLIAMLLKVRSLDTCLSEGCVALIVVFLMYFSIPVFWLCCFTVSMPVNAINQGLVFLIKRMDVAW